VILTPEEGKALTKLLGACSLKSLEEKGLSIDEASTVQKLYNPFLEVFTLGNVK
jgi:hypothetical protein